MRVSGLPILGARVLGRHLHDGQPGADEAYTYAGVLSVLLVHDALVLRDSGAITAKPGAA